MNGGGAAGGKDDTWVSGAGCMDGKAGGRDQEHERKMWLVEGHLAFQAY